VTVESFVRRLARPRFSERRIKELALERFKNVTELEITNILNKLKLEKSGVSNIECEKLKRELDFYKKEYEVFKEKRNIIDEVISLCRANIQPLEEPAKIKFTEKDSRLLSETAVLLLSDLHLGFNVSELEAPCKDMVYNIEIASEKMIKLIKSFIDIITEKRNTRNIKNLVICFIGDIVEGNWLTINQTKDDIVKQIFNGVKIVSGIISETSKYFDKINIYCVYGNHGVIQKGQPDYVNWDYIFYRFLEETLSGFETIEIEIPTIPYHVFEILNHKYCIMHGGNIRMFYRTPYYGIETADINLKAILGRFGVSYDVLILGHFHQPAFLPTQSGVVIMNGSLTGFTPFGFKIQRFYPANQVCFGVHPNHKITWVYSLEV